MPFSSSLSVTEMLANYALQAALITQEVVLGGSEKAGIFI